MNQKNLMTTLIFFFFSCLFCLSILAPSCPLCLDANEDGLCDDICYDGNNNGVCDDEEVPCPDDADCDGVCDEDDNCPSVFNTDQEDSDGDSVGDICDNCRFLYNPDQSDTDLDRIGDVCDSCPDTENFHYDSDIDGVDDACDNCQYVYNPDQEDSDGDGVGNACEEDDTAELLVPQEYSTVQAAVDAATSGSTILIDADGGPYEECVTLDGKSSVTLRGVDERPEIQAPMFAGCAALRVLDSGDIVLENLFIENDDSAIAALVISSFSSDVRVIDIHVRSLPYKAMIVSHSSVSIKDSLMEGFIGLNIDETQSGRTVTVEDSVIYGSNTGIATYQLADVKIIRTSVTGGGYYGVYIEGINTLLENVVIADSEYGIKILGCNVNATLVNTTIGRSGTTAIKDECDGGQLTLRNSILAYGPYGMQYPASNRPMLEGLNIFWNENPQSWECESASGWCTDPMLQPSFIPLIGSPAIDNAVCETPDLDIEKTHRPLDGNGDNLAVSDIGAYEVVY